MADPRYPIGQVKLKGALTTDERHRAFTALAALPDQLYSAVRGLSETQLDTPYRAGGWNLRQVVLPSCRATSPPCGASGR